MKQIILPLMLLMVSIITSAQTLVSPNKKIRATLTLTAEQPTLSVTCDGEPVVEQIRLGLKVNNTVLRENLTLASVSKVTHMKERYTTLHGKRSHCQNEANALTATFTVPAAAPDSPRAFSLEIRAYNDGLCFRYAIQHHNGVLKFLDEYTAYTFPADAPRWLQQFVTSYEGDFPLQHGAEKQGAWNYPMLFQAHSRFLLITEANPDREYCSTHVSNETHKDTYKVSFPYEWEGCGQGDILPVTHASTWHSPWRVLIMGDLKTLVESTLVEDVSNPTTLTATDWIQSGRASWIYWAYNHGTKDYKICCDYIDLAAQMGWEYVLFDWEWDAMTNGGNLQDAARYALSRGIKPLIWYNSGGPHNGVPATPRDRFLTHENRVKELAWLKSLGFVGVKIDFFESDKQSMMQYYLDILQDCAQAQMMVNFHGCTLPRGWSRTYPHLMSMEAVYGAEQYNNSPRMTPIAARLNCTLPFTRNVVGPMDYTPVAFTHSQHPHTTTYAHELALSVAFESGIQHWADRPNGFRNLSEEAQQHMKTVPTAWDDTRFIDGHPGTHILIARRKGTTWYVAGLNGTDAPLTLHVPTTFLSKGTYALTLLTDGDAPTTIAASHSIATRRDRLTLPCLPQGGFVLKFEKKK